MQNAYPMKNIFDLLLITVMITAFLSGWGVMIKSAVDEKKYDEPYLIIKIFIPGIGEFFLPVLGTIFIFFVINFAILIAACVCGMLFIGDIGIDTNELMKAMSGQEALKAFLSTLSVEQLTKLNNWNALILSTMTGLSFIFMLYYPALIYESKNPFKALWISVKRTFGKKILSNIGIFIVIFSLNLLISVLSALFSGNTIMHFVMALVKFYFICAVAIGIFYYYNKNFINSHLGNSIDTYI
jgi:hypothetical protein